MGLGELTGLLLATALGNSLVLAQGLGADRLLQPVPLADAARHGTLTALVGVIVAGLAWLLQHFFLAPFALDLYAPFALVLLVPAVTALVAQTLQRWRPGYAATQWLLIACNSAVIAGAIAVQGQDRGFGASLIVGLAYGGGFAACLLLLSGLEQRLQPQGAPAAFRGLPLRLLNAGLLLLACAGLDGIGRG
ncbi:electron transport complex protein RnfA [Tahibacter aquaticus]|uniref:Electron transport complex protein RnfA n=1 Tax=Tahibacter aquaticus TaxID=520092 RepID=A0A4R6YYI1_9GAMM|nr:Rnf-Nqr domain containing protein [Tahibacter aquaticus]TDR44075.1 electron transport complex protein RnfA [Tahibacter aquaticus]